MEPESKSCPSTAPNSATHETSPSTARTTDEPCVVSRRQVCETFEALFDYEAPHLPRFKRVDDSYLAVMGLEVYREVAKEPEPANVGAVRCNFLKGQPGSMVRLAGSEGYWLKVSPRLETGAYSPKIEASQAVLGVYEMMNGVKLGRPVGDINQDIIYDAQIPTLRRFELAKGEGNGMPVYREVRGEVEMVRSIGSTHPGADLLVRLEDKDGLWYRG